MIREWRTRANLKWKALLKRRQLDRDLDDEIEFHLAMREKCSQAGGSPPGEARDSARRVFGNSVSLKERCREMWTVAPIETLWQDVRYGLRILHAKPAFTAVAILSLALGIGANTAIFSLIDAILLRDLPVRNPGQLVELMPANKNGDNAGTSVAMFEAFEKRQQVFSTMFARIEGGTANIETPSGFVRNFLWGADGEFYDGLGASPLIGRFITRGDVNLHSGAPAQVAVLGYDFWIHEFRGDPNVVGRTIRIEGQPFDVIGISRETFTGMRADIQPAVTVPFTAFPLTYGENPDRVYDRKWRSLDVTGRLKDGVTRQQAEAQLQSLWPSIQAETLPSDSTPSQRQEFLSNRLVVKAASKGFTPLHKRFVEPLYILMGIAAMILLIACVNLASLLVSRAAARSHEITVRVSLGASRLRLARQLLTESLILSIAGSAVGFVLAMWGSRALANFILGQIFFAPTRLNLNPDWRILGFTAGVALLTAVLFGLTPALNATRQTLAASLQESPRTVQGSGRSGKLLVCTQIALSLVLLMSAALFIRSLQNLRSEYPGFQTTGVLQASLMGKPGGYKELNNATYYRGLIQKVSALPGVASVGVSEGAPPTNIIDRVSVVPESSAPDRPGFETDVEMFSPGVFETLGMKIEQGRDFCWTDDKNATTVAILSESLAKLLFPGENAVGRHIVMPSSNIFPDEKKTLLVVGVAGDAGFWNIRERHAPELYLSGLQSYLEYGELLVRSNVDPRSLAPSVQRIVESMGHEYVLLTESISDHIDRVLLQERVTAMFSAFFGGLALLLASIGLYGLMSYGVTQRTREIGLRMALGAQRREVLWMVLRETLLLILVGIAVGVPCALAATRLIANQLFGLSPRDPVTLAVVAAMLLGVGALAGYLPSRRATKIDPIVALRHE